MDNRWSSFFSKYVTEPPSAEITPEPNVEETTAGKKSSIEAAVAALAQRQQQEIERLMAQQAKEREELRALFKRQQDQLIAEVLKQIQRQSLGDSAQQPSVANDASSSTSTAATTPTTLRHEDDDPTSGASNIANSSGKCPIKRTNLANSFILNYITVATVSVNLQTKDPKNPNQKKVLLISWPD